MRRLRLLLWPAGIVLGIAAEAVLYGLGHPHDWLPDLLAGWSLIACGLIAWSRRPESRTGALMTATGGAWFAGNFFSQLLYLHRGPLVQLALTYPSGRIRGRLERAAIAVGYVAAVVTAIWRSQPATIVLSVLLLAVAAHGYATAGGRDRRERLAALATSAVVAAVLAGNAALRLAFPTEATTSATLLVYQLTLFAFAIGLAAGLFIQPWKRPAVADLVVELGEARSGTLRDALARAVGDPTLEVGFWLPEAHTFVDATGRTVEVPADDPGRAVTRVERDGRTVAVLVHDPVVLDDPRLVDALDAAARLAASNARLNAEVRAQVSELRASRRRLVRAGDEQRRRLEQRLRDGAERRLAALADALGQVRSAANGGLTADTVAKIERADDHVAGTLAELHELAGGLHPRALTENGLARAITALAERSAVPVDVALPSERQAPELEAAVYFVCSEALANVAKYASASRVAVTMTAGGDRVRVAVVDDGVGGADPGRGTGIRGLADRVEALGGTLHVDSPAGRGTRLAVELPCDVSGA